MKRLREVTIRVLFWRLIKGVNCLSEFVKLTFLAIALHHSSVFSVGRFSQAVRFVLRGRFEAPNWLEAVNGGCVRRLRLSARVRVWRWIIAENYWGWYLFGKDFAIEIF